MSSHHVVKEDQEPALVVAGDAGRWFREIHQLLEWCPTTVVLEDSLEQVLSWGIKFDVLICRYENVKQQVAALAGHAPLKILSHQPDEHPLDTALMFLVAGKYKAVNVTGISPHHVAPPITGLDIVTFYNGLRWSYVRNGLFEKWLKEGTRLQFISQGALVKEGLVNDTVCIQGMVKITGDDAFWVGEPYA